MASVFGWFMKKKVPTANSEAVVPEKEEKNGGGKDGMAQEKEHIGDGDGLKEDSKGGATEEEMESDKNYEGNKDLFDCDIKTFLSLDIEKVSRNITMNDWKVYKSITRKDIEESDTSHIIQKLNQNHDQIYFWTLETVLSGKVAKIRSKIISKFLKIASGLLLCNDFNATHAIVSSLQDFAILRMDKTWKKMTKNKTHLFKSLQELFSEQDNHFQLTQQMLTTHEVNSILIPHMALFLKDFNALQYLQYDKRILTIRRNWVIWEDISKLHTFRSDLELPTTTYWTLSPDKQSHLEEVANERSRFLEPPKRYYKIMNVSEINLDDY